MKKKGQTGDVVSRLNSYKDTYDRKKKELADKYSAKPSFKPSTEISQAKIPAQPRMKEPVTPQEHREPYN